MNRIHIGIFSRTFNRPTLDDVLEAIAAHGISYVHLNLKSAGVESLPDEISEELCARIRDTFAVHRTTMTSVSGTFNAIHPDPRRRAADTHRASRIIESARRMGTSVVSLCTGSRDSEDMWRRHPDNQLPDAWRDLLATLELLLPVAESAGVVLGIEPEMNNVIDSAPRARRLLDELRSPNLKLILDGANLFDASDLSGMGEVLQQAFDLLQHDIVIVHAKDITGDPAHARQAAGTGRLDWSTYCRLLKQSGYEGAVVLHNLLESEVDFSDAFVKQKLGEWYPEMHASAPVEAAIELGG